MNPPPVAYRGRVKYDDTTARQYQTHDERKHRAEMRLVERAFSLVPKNHRVLDVPCGGGRVSVHLSRLGYNLACGDLSESMIEITRQTMAAAGLACPVERQDVEKLSFPDRAFDTIVSFRLFHHFPSPEIRQRVVTELCRVARKYVALSYFSPASVTSARRSLRAALGGRKSEKHPTPRREVEGYFRTAGFRLVQDFARMPLIHTLHLAIFERIGESRP